MTSAYGALANQGTVAAAHRDPLRDRRAGQARSRRTCREPREAVSPETAYVITHMLRGTVERGTGQAAKALGRPDRGQDRHDQRLLERVVHRLHAAAGHRGMGRLRPAAQPRQGRDRLARRGADLGNYMGKVARRIAPRKTSRCRSVSCWCPSTWTRRTSACGSCRWPSCAGTEPAVGCGPRAAERPRQRCAAGRGARTAASTWRLPVVGPAPAAPPLRAPPPSAPAAALPPAAARPKDTLEVPSVSAPVTHGAPTPVPRGSKAVRPQPSARG